MPDLAVIVIAALATARLTGIVTDDDITRRPRGWIVRKVAPNDGDEHPIATLVTCPWCAGFWIALAVAVIIYTSYGEPWVYVGLLALASSQVVGMIAKVGR